MTQIREQTPGASPGAAPAPGRDRRTVVYALVTATLLILAYTNTFQVPFVYDDHHAIRDNTTIRSLNPSRVLFHGKRSAMANRPVVNYSLAVNYAISQNRVWSYHAANLAIHILAALFLFGIVRRTLATAPMGRFRSRAPELAFAAALLWALHPLNTQAVTYTIQRCESLMGMFFLASLYCAIRGFQSPEKKNRWHAAALAAFVLGAGSKEVMAAAPLVIFLYDLTFFPKPVRETLSRSRLLYVGLAAGFLALVSFYGATALSLWGRTEAAVSNPREWGAFAYLITQAKALLYYLRLASFPNGLSLDHGWKALSLKEALPYGAAILVLLGLTFRGVLKRRPLGFAGAWCFLTLAPSSSIVATHTLVVEHRMYLPLAALCTVVVLTAWSLAARVFSKKPEKTVFAGFMVAILALALVLGGVTFLRNRDYRSEADIWEAAVRVNPENPGARVNLALALIEEGRYSESLAQSRKALELDPGNPEATANLAVALSKLGRDADAVRFYEEALKKNPASPEAYYNLGNILARYGHLEKAAACFEGAIKINPDYAKALNNLGNVRRLQKRAMEAVDLYNRALTADPGFTGARANLGAALLEMNLPEKALEPLTRAVAEEPRNLQPRIHLAYALARTGKLSEALKETDQALSQAPQNQTAQALKREVERLLKD